MDEVVIKISVDDEMKAELRKIVGAEIAYKIRAELVCCDILDTKNPSKAERAGHAICYWGEAAARLAEGRPADEDGF